jgi:hypothetical protein
MYIKPELNKKLFTCSFCGGNNQHAWNFYCRNATYLYLGGPFSESEDVLGISVCEVCKNFTIWLNGKQIYPLSSGIEEPNIDMPEDIKNLYLEARDVYPISKKSSAALLRLALQLLCKNLGEKGENINNDIANLVKKGLPEVIQKALDTLRITGNQAVHPGELNLEENIELVESLFWILNFIVDETYSKKKKINELYNKLPKNLLNAIEKRDK